MNDVNSNDVNSAGTLLIGSAGADVRRLAAALDAALLALPDEATRVAAEWSWADELERWRASESAGPKAERIAVAAWPAEQIGGPSTGLDVAAWELRTEQRLARWAVALGVAVARVADGGSIVAVAEGPTPLECSGWAPETAIAEGVRALARSLALSEGGRGVRVNTVSTPARFPFEELVHPAPPMPTFPGTLEREVAGAVRMLLSADAAGVTGGIVHADAGRAWR
jgi:NAD(P)-dependent dehydrogenase (short-subunit alcohol dehydrogenase family)